MIPFFKILAKTKWLLLLFTAICFFGAEAQNIEFEHINRNNGLPSNNVTSIVQDKYGMMWFGTFNGLVRFDGYNYKIFLHDPSDTFSLADNMVRSLLITSDSNLLVATENHGFAIFDYKTERFSRYMHKEKNKSSLSNNNIITVFNDSKGKIWVGTWDGLNRFDPVTKRFHFFRIRSNIVHKHEHDFISSIEEERDGKLLLYTTGSRLIRFNPGTQTYDFIKFPHLPKPKLRLNRGGILYRDKLGYLWVGTEFDGLFRMDQKSGDIRHYSVQNGKLGSNILMSIFQDSKERLWVATDGGGLFSYSYKTDHFTSYHYDPNHFNSISSNAVYTVFEDKDGHIWIGTYAAGLNVIKNKKRKFEVYTNKGKEGFRLSYKSVLSFEDADSGNVWVGTDGGGLNLFKPKDKSFVHYSKINSNICSNIVKSLLKDSRGDLWIGTYGSGLCKADLTRMEFTHYSPFDTSVNKKIGHVNVWSLKEDKDSNVWIGMLDAGLDKYDRKRDTMLSYPANPSENNLLDGSILSMLIDRKNNVWAGTEAGGLCLLDSNRKRFDVFLTDQNKFSLPSNNIHALMEDSKGRIWVGTKDGGLSVLVDRKAKKFKNYTIADGLPGASVNAIEEDAHGNIWAATDNGLACLDHLTGKFQVYDKSDGLQSLEFAMGASFKDKNGFIYFGGTDGFNRFHPDSLRYNKAKPNVYISGINLFNKPLQPWVRYQDKVYIKKPIHLLDTLVLSYTDYVFSIQFTCTDYTSPEKNQFAYRLEGFEEEWNYVDASVRMSTYTNLEPGRYLFRVKASNNDGVWNETGASLFVIVRPPWWNTWWFKSLVVIVLVGGLVVFYYIRLNRIRRQNIVLSKLVRQKTSELQGVNARLRDQNEEIIASNEKLEVQRSEIVQQKEELQQINSKLNQFNATKDKLFSIIGHDLRNPVTALTSLTEMLQHNYQMLSEKDRAQIVDHIYSSATSLKFLVINLLDWAMVQSKHLSPRPEVVSIRKVAEECFKLSRLHAFAKSIYLENLCSEEHMVFADKDMLQTAIRNLVGNAIKFTDRDGVVSLKSKVDGPNHVIITVADTGAGMTPSQIEQLLSNVTVDSTKGTSNEKGSGLGLVIVREFIEANNGTLYIESVPDQGTTFFIRLPKASL